MGTDKHVINMILSFINISKIPREVLKTSGFALDFQHLPWDLGTLQMLMNGKSCYIPILNCSFYFKFIIYTVKFVKMQLATYSLLHC